MATKLSNLNLEIKHFNHARAWIPGIEDLNQHTIDHLLNNGMIQVSTAVEHAEANRQGTQVVSEDTHDLANGCDVKCSSVRTHNYGKCYGAPVSNIHGKTGDLIVGVYERLQDRYYRFRIPHGAYRHITKTSNIEIPFELDGTPRPSNKWWRFLIRE